MSNPIFIIELKELIAARLSLEEIMDVLGWSTYDLVEYLEEEIEYNMFEFVKAVGED